MNHRTILSRLDEERRTLVRDGEVLDVRPLVTRHRAADHSHHSVICSALSAGAADAVIAGEIEHHRQLGVGFEWKLYAHDEPADLRERLARHGLTIGPCEAVLVYDLANAAAWIHDKDTHAVARVDRVEQLVEYRRAAEAIFNKNYEFTITELAAALEAGSTQNRGYVAYVDGDPVSIGRLYTHPESHFGGLYGGGTVPTSRGRGLYRAVIAARARDAIALGARYLIVDALPTSRPILERLGFEHLTDSWPCEWTPE